MVGHFPSSGPGDVFAMLAILVASCAGVLSLMAAAVAIAYIRSGRLIFARLYWIVFWLTIVGHVSIVVVEPRLLFLAWVGPGFKSNGQVRDPLEQLNIVVLLALAFFFSAPLLRQHLERR
jgi:hypothetical protein